MRPSCETIRPNDTEAEQHRIERWLREEATTSYDEYKVDPTRVIPADQVM